MARGTVFSILIYVGLSHLLNDMMQSVIPALYPIVKDSYSLTFTEIGIINLVYQLTSCLLQPCVGVYIDKRKRPYMLAAGMAFTFTGLLLLSGANGFYSLMLSTAIVGCGSSVFHPGAARMAQMASGGRKGLAQSIFQVGGNAGSAFGPLLAALIIQPFGQQSISWFAGVALVAMLVLFRVGRWYKGFDDRYTHSAKRPMVKGHSLSVAQVRWAVVMLLVLVFSKYFYMACVTNYFTFYLIDTFSLNVQQAQIGLFAFLASSAVGTLAGGAVGDKYGRKKVIVGSILGCAPFAIAMPYASLTGCMVLVIIIGLVISSAFSSIVVYATDLMPTRVGVVSGFFYGFMFGMGGVVSAFLGWLADATCIQTIFHVCSWSPLLGIIALWLPNVKSGE